MIFAAPLDLDKSRIADRAKPVVPAFIPAIWRPLVAAARGLGLGAKSFGWHFCSSDRHGFAGSAPSSHTAITAAISLLFFSFIIT